MSEKGKSVSAAWRAYDIVSLVIFILIFVAIRNYPAYTVQLGIALAVAFLGDVLIRLIAKQLDLPRALLLAVFFLFMFYRNGLFG